jgi:hypothetical protein
MILSFPFLLLFLFAQHGGFSCPFIGNFLLFQRYLTQSSRLVAAVGVLADLVVGVVVVALSAVVVVVVVFAVEPRNI